MSVVQRLEAERVGVAAVEMEMEMAVVGMSEEVRGAGSAVLTHRHPKRIP